MSFGEAIYQDGVAVASVGAGTGNPYSGFVSGRYGKGLLGVK